MKYISKPTQIDAIQWKGNNQANVKLFAEDKVITVTDPIQILAGVDGAQGWVSVPVGHWIVSQPDDRSDMWPVEDEYFQAKYEVIYPVRPCRRCDDTGWISESIIHPTNPALDAWVVTPCSGCNS